MWLMRPIKGWVSRPDQILNFHVDRATDVIVNGMIKKASDVRIGDHLGVEIRPDQHGGGLRPFLIFVYRYDAGGTIGGKAP